MERFDHSKVSSSRLQKALFLYLATALLVLALTMALTISLTLLDHMKTAEDKSIVHAAQMQAMTIGEWCRRAKDLAMQITSRTRIRQELEKYNRGEIPLNNIKAFTEPKLRDAMDLSEDIIGILRLDARHRVVAVCGYGSDLPIMDKAAQEFISDDIHILKPRRINGRLSITVSAPIQNRKGERHGTDLVILDTNRLKTIVSPSEPTVKQSNIVIGYQARDAIAFLFPLKSTPNGADWPKAVQTMISKAIAGKTGIKKIYKKLVAYTPIPETRWGLVMAKDENGLYGPFYRKMAHIGILFIIIYLLIVLGFGVVIKPLAGRILLHADDLEKEIQAKTAVLEKEINRRTEVEKRLRENEQFLASVFDSIQDGISVLTPDLKIARTNKTMKAWFAGYPSMEGRSCFEVFQGRYKPCQKCPVTRSIENGKLEMEEIPITKGGIETGVLEVYAFPMFDDEGRVAGIVEYVRDVSRQKHAEQEMRDLTRKLKTAQQLANSGWWEYDVRNNAVIWPDETYALFGLNRDKTVLDYNRLMQQIHPDYRDYHGHQHRMMLEKGNSEFQYPIIRQDGEQRWIWAKGEAEYDENGKPIRLFGTLQDITARKQAEQALADSQRQLTDIIEFLPDPTFVIDNDSRVISWNRAMERITGVDKKEMIGKGGYAYAVPFYGEPRPLLIDLVLTRDQQWESKYLSLKVKNGAIIGGESFNPLMVGGERYLAATAGRLYDARGDVVGAIEVIRDITDAKRTEQERERLIIELKEAIAQVKTLSGLLPMCTKCKKVRDDRGYWNQLETYISRNTDAAVSHAICPQCAKELYGDQDWYEKEE